MLVHKEGGDKHRPDPMNAITNVLQSDPAGLMFVCLGFEVVAANRFVFKEMMSMPKNILRLGDKRVEQLLNVACKPGGGVAGVPAAKLDECNFKLLVYYVKLCELRIRPVVLDEIKNNALRSIEDHRNLATLHGNMEKPPPGITQRHISKNIDLVWEIVN